MNNNYALLVGINVYSDPRLRSLKYAEKDCEELYQLITDDDIGIFPKNNTTKLIGKDAILDKIMEKLYSFTIHNPTNMETFLIYFSGHGFIHPLLKKTFLATHDLSLAELQKNPTKGLDLQLLHDQIFQKANAKNVIFILDACHSGDFAPSTCKDECDNSLINENFFSNGNGKIAIVSCPSDAKSRESDTLENGVFTHYLLKGLKGAAIELGTNEVTIDSLLSYIRKNIPPTQPPGRYGHDYGRILLSKHPESKVKIDRSKLSWSNKIDQAIKRNPHIEYIPMPNRLDRYSKFINSFIRVLKNDKAASKYEPGKRLLDAIRIVIDADFICLLRGDENGWNLGEESNINKNKLNRSEPIQIILSKILPTFISDNIFSKSHIGKYISYRNIENDSTNSLLVIPLEDNDIKEMMLIYGIPDDSCLISDTFALIVKAIYLETQCFITINPELIEAAIYDYLKKFNNFVPIGFYDRRFRLFTERLSKMVIHFQPILFLSKKEPYICGWEALARDPDNSKAPNDLFKAAELWGRQFMIELDMFFIKKATMKFRETLAMTEGRKLPEDFLDFSVNVYPESLMHQPYFDVVSQIIKDEIIPHDKFFLEISEKSALPEYLESGSVVVGMKSYREVLEKYVFDLKIGFAIDDFGAGHASLGRLAELHPSYVKVDREVLLYKSVYDVVEYSCNLIGNLVNKPFLRNSKVVFEGFDYFVSSKVKLHSLYDAGVRYIQGYIVGEAGPDIPLIADDVKSLIISLLDDSKEVNETKGVCFRDRIF